jgi:uncharacterized protein
MDHRRRDEKTDFSRASAKEHSMSIYGFGGTSGLLDDEKLTRNTEFFTACRIGNQEEAARLLAQGADLDTQRTDMTALFIATQQKHRELALWLLEQGADANCRNQFGWTGLHEAISQEDEELVRAYLDATALATRAVDRTKETPLITACKKGNEAIARLLMAKGVSVKPVDREGNTALHYAAHNGETSLCEALLDRGAVVTAMNNEGKNCVDVASNNELASLLERRSITEAIQAVKPTTPDGEQAPAEAPRRKILKA